MMVQFKFSTKKVHVQFDLNQLVDLNFINYSFWLE